jgi:hypothetical protein
VDEIRNGNKILVGKHEEQRLSGKPLLDGRMLYYIEMVTESKE